MKNKIIILLLLLFVINTKSSFTQENDFNEILATAVVGYKNLLEKIPKGYEYQFGFRNRDEFARARIGKPYQLFSLSNEFITDTKVENKDYLVPSPEWYVSIMVDNEFRVLITVSKIHGFWEVVGIGAAGLANELGEIDKNHPSINKWGIILRIHQLECDFLLMPQENDSKSFNAYFLTSAYIAMDKKVNTNSPYSLKQVLLSIKNKIDNN
jgi:hypothetical protein